MEKRIGNKGDKKILGVNFNKPLSLIVISVLLFIISSYSWGWAQAQTKGDARFGIWSPGYSQNKELYQLFLDAGARQTIASLSWKRVSQDPKFLSIFDSDISKAIADGVTVVLVLKTSTKWSKVKESNFSYPIEDFRADAPPKDPDEWYNFIYHIVKRYKGKIKYYGIMDEVYWTFSGTIEEYLELLKIASKAIHSADPDAKVIPSFSAPALFIVWEMNDLLKDGKEKEAIDLHNWFFEGFKRPLTNENDLKTYLEDERTPFKRAIQLLDAIYSDYSQYIDVYEFHSYNPYHKTLHILNYIKSKMAKQGINKPIIAEIGTLPKASVDEITRQEDVVRNFAITLGNGVSMACWFALIDAEGKSCGLIEGSFGKKTFTPRPAYSTFKLMTSKIGGYNLTEPINLGKDIFAFKFIKDSKPVYILWSEEEKVVKLPVKSEKVKVTDISGNMSESSSSRLHLTKSPVFVEEKVD